MENKSKGGSLTKQSQFDKQCPECKLYVHSKGYKNHVRKHGINPDSINAPKQIETHEYISNLEHDLREKLAAVEQELASTLAKVEKMKTDKKQLEDVLLGFNTVRTIES